MVVIGASLEQAAMPVIMSAKYEKVICVFIGGGSGKSRRIDRGAHDFVSCFDLEPV